MDSARLSCCPACSSAELEPFYRRRSGPAHSCLLFENSISARGYPKADIELAVCHRCGFICNTRFEASKVSYRPGYEDQQSYSETFNAFSNRLAESLTRRFDLHRKRIIEIGCGRGDFLRQLCELGNNKGTGIDPSIDPSRLEGGTEQRVQWVRAQLDHEHRRFIGDFYCCRHTLEHIPQVADFIRTLRDIMTAEDSPVFIEVPDTIRVLRDCALEDIYHEHCSYFTPGSLARLFRSAGFAVTGLYLDFNDQYLMLEASAARQRDGTEYALEESVAETLALVQSFRQAAADKEGDWRRMVQDHKNEKIALWGSGSKCVAFLDIVGAKHPALRVVDINPHRQGKYLPGSGLKIHSPAELASFKPALIIVMNAIYLSEIASMTSSMGLTSKLVSL